MPNGKDYIVYQNTKRGDRKITFIDGYAFYQSTGTNSGFEATWFPFLGVADPDSDDQRYKLDSYANNRGHFIKPNIFFRDIPEEVESAGKYLGLNEDFFYRMGNLECLLISSLIKEGYWLTNKGILFKEHLQKTYPAFYQQYGDIEFSADPLQVIPSAEPFRVNDWLLIQGPMKKIATTKKADDLTIADKRKQFAKGKISPRNDVDAMEIDSIAETSIPCQQNLLVRTHVLMYLIHVPHLCRQKRRKPSKKPVNRLPHQILLLSSEYVSLNFGIDSMDCI